MFSRFSWRPLAGAVLVILPAIALMPGCGGGGSGGSGSGLITRYTGVELLSDNGGGVLARSNLSVTFSRSTQTTQNVVGYLLVLGKAPTTTATASATATVTATTAAQLQQRQTRALPTDYKPSPATYQVRGTVTIASATADPIVNLQGSFEPQRPFTITGSYGLNADANHPFILTSTFVRPNVETQSGTLQLNVLPEPFSIDAVPTSAPTIAPTPAVTPSPTPVA